MAHEVYLPYRRFPFHDRAMISLAVSLNRSGGAEWVHREIRGPMWPPYNRVSRGPFTEEMELTVGIGPRHFR